MPRSQFWLLRQVHIVRLNNGAWTGRVNPQVQLELCLLIPFCFLLMGTSDYVLINGRARGRWRRFILIILVSNVCVIFLFNYNECAFGVHELSTAFFTGSSLVKDSFAAVNHCYIFHTKPFVLPLLVTGSRKWMSLMEILCVSLKPDKYNSIQRNEKNLCFL